MTALARIFCLRGRRTLDVPPPAHLLDQTGRHLANRSPAILVSISQRRLRREPSTTVTEVPLRLGKRALRAAQLLGEAQRWADELTLREMRDPTEPLDDVWRRLEAKTGVPYGTFWSLRWRYRQLKDIWGSVHSLLQEAHERQEADAHKRQRIKDDIAAITGRRGEI